MFDADGHDRWVDLTLDVVKSLGPKKLLWVDVDRAAEDAQALLGTVENVLELRTTDFRFDQADAGRARLRRAADRIHLTVEALEADDDDPVHLVRREIDLIAGPNFVVSIHNGKSDAVQRFHSGLDRETRLGMLTAGDLLSSLVDEVLDGYFLLAELIDRDIDRLDQAALNDARSEEILERIVALRRRIGLVRRTLAPHRYVLSTLALPEMRAEEIMGRPMPGLNDRLESAMDAVNGLRDSLIGTFDIHMSRVSQRANDVMRTLTLLSAILLPAVVLAGIMGMNFKLEFFDTTANFWLVLVAMAGLAIAILAVARARGWL